MQGFSKLVFGDDGAATAVACSRCGATRCFCKQDLQPAVVQSVSAKRNGEAATSSGTKKARKVELPAAQAEPSAEQAAAQKAAARKAERKALLRAAHRAALEAAPRSCPAKFREWKAGLSKAQRKAARKAARRAQGEPTSDGQERLQERVPEHKKPRGGNGEDDHDDEPWQEEKEEEEEEEDDDDDEGPDGGDEGRVGAMLEAALRARRGSVVPLHSEDEWRAALRLSSELTVIVDFSAEWCGPCQAIAPLFARLCTQHAQQHNALFVHVDVDELEEAATEATVTAMPTFAVYRAGACVDRVEGGSGSALEGFVRRALVG